MTQNMFDLLLIRKQNSDNFLSVCAQVNVIMCHSLQMVRGQLQVLVLTFHFVSEGVAG